ncbi:hypothetical protein [uncultured Roseobacter sp.]|uniref:hypothetical protein n=1 Tax=uncultured Roseobacter sp. TaxID=114847 RepID=UPI00261903D8|nr:hypothetical protein [uncultured Roseobacter sp.]
MTPELNKRGGVTIGSLSTLCPWEALLVRELRLWCAGPSGQAAVWRDYASHLSSEMAAQEIRVFGDLITLLSRNARRPLVHHCVDCDCLGADEGVFLHIVGAASEGDLGDAAMLAGLVVLPAHAEHVALLAAQVGTVTRRISRSAAKHKKPGDATNVVRLH